MTLELKSLKSEPAALLETDGWTVGKLAVTTVVKLVMYKGIGKVGARKIIAEAAEMLNAQGLAEADKMADDHYYQKATPDKILADWEADGLLIENVALSSARALAAMKGIDDPLALRIISAAQDIVNKRGLYQGHAVPTGPTRQTNAAFDEKWLSGEVEPPSMNIRVKRIFDEAQREYREANG